MQNMNPREKLLAVLTAVGVLFAVAWYSGLEGAISSFGAGGSEVAALEKRFENNLKALENMYRIEREFRRIGEFPASEDGQLRPELAFPQQVAQICRDLGFDFPPLQADTEEIEGVEEYRLINVAVKTEGTYQDTIELLKTFNDNGLIFRDVDLTGTRDRDILVARVTVARIIEANPDRNSRSNLSRRRN